ncbi:glucose-1-phosphate adenylyltransferase [Halothiobacillus neapolitanus]|jgi:glucose-1-phosphate adenylyltransferase|uniref:Glucose-1-phosphate adenylyltransferase n=1 Tax=Halothiobacillus neapolitanus (strain ATCC 23641 / DSM 15147 / CIP 104769 / NCIMB 8539 / c2) TaxID=555778 RepID=D0KYV2_HALNC|nr:glucose-1-phosphate adenylyltransferase [Halothiobacillus neapolitanus c2]OZB75947.1 MAG: glucose-1-phosphate adenylyltransferase [Halothiobacillus sp. 14-55-98]OZB83513.1 MAG: glucose-1-phosphate adenylyltransferase [Halothiobacillus sp. 13-55-253]TDN65927.1 glucose-1-phosphate adenylyltransferase [Halothiobacillus neapolitanus]
MLVDSPKRLVSRITRDTLALVLSGGRGSRLKQLTDWRAKPAVPFGGKFRIIDFPLSNCVNSGIRRMAVLTQYKAHSLIKHVQLAWGTNRMARDEFVELLPAQQRINEQSWYSGTADAVYQNIDILRTHDAEYTLILAGDHIYKMDYGPMIAYHVEKGADLTIGCIEVPLEEAKAFGVMGEDGKGRVNMFVEKPDVPPEMPGNPGKALASMGIYVFNTKFLFEQLIYDADDPNSDHDFGKNVIPRVIKRYQVFAYPFRDVQNNTQAYWRDVGTIDSYWAANLELIGVTPDLNLYDTDWPIWTHQEQLPPAKFVFDDEDRRGMAVDTMVSGGCIISGALVRHSLLFSNVIVNEHASVENSVILPNVIVNKKAKIRNAVVDKGCVIPEGMEIGFDPVADKQRFEVSPNGIVLVTPDMLGQRLHMVR